MRALIFISVLICPTIAHATMCDAQITRAQRVLREAQSSVTLPQSTSAQLHRQPTPQSVANADSEAKLKLTTALAQAEKLNSQGKDKECLAVLDKVLPPGL